MQQKIKTKTPKKKNHENILSDSQPVELKLTTVSDDSKQTEDSTVNPENSISPPKSKKRKQKDTLSGPITPLNKSRNSEIKENIFKSHLNEVDIKLKEIKETPSKRKKRLKEELNLELEVQDVNYDDVRTSPLKVIPEVQGELETNSPDAVPPKKKKSKRKVILTKNKVSTPASLPQDPSVASKNTNASKAKDDVHEKYPVLNNEELIKKFLKVSMTNNQKGRIRQVLRDLLKGTTQVLLPDIIHNKIMSILKSSENLTDTELRKIRILFNMLKTAVDADKNSDIEKASSEKKKKKKSGGDGKDKVVTIKEHKEKETLNKVKGPKRYVVFVGNLPLNVNKETILNHFSEFKECIKDVRIPHRDEGKKSCIAYVELMNEPTYELALSKHHSMLGSKRINVLYTTQQKSKISRADAKSKSAKLQAMLRSGQLLGSVPLKKKRSHRRAMLKQARKAAESNQ